MWLLRRPLKTRGPNLRALTVARDLAYALHPAAPNLNQPDSKNQPTTEYEELICDALPNSSGSGLPKEATYQEEHWYTPRDLNPEPTD